MKKVNEQAPHIPVMANEVLEILNPQPGQTFVDATCGFMGHSQLVMDKIEGRGNLVMVDRDPDVIQQNLLRLRELKKEHNHQSADSLTLVNDSYANIRSILRSFSIRNIDGIFWDLGVNSQHLDESARGFSFRFDGPLNMLFDPKDGLTAEEVINRMPEEELANIIYQYGEERRSRPLAKAIVEARKAKRISTTFELANIIRKIVPRSKKDKQDPCVRTFQALRIHCNQELEHLKKGLVAGLKMLKPGGVAIAISFHSLEDRICKLIFMQAAGRLTEIHENLCPEENFKGKYELVFKKVKVPTEEEMKNNPRSRSAKLRAIRRVE